MTIDELVMSALQEKDDTQNSLLKALKAEIRKEKNSI